MSAALPRAVRVLLLVALLGAAYWAAQTSTTRFLVQAPRADVATAPATTQTPAAPPAPMSAPALSAPPAVAGSSEQLPGESAWLAGGALNAEAIGPILRSERFTDVLDEMSRDASSDTDAAELTQAYEDAIRVQIGTTPVFDLDRIACGLRVCALRMTGSDDEHAWLAWLERFRNDAQTPHGAMIDSRVEARPGVFERRVVFATTPGS